MILESFSLAGKVAIITGAGRGLGRDDHALKRRLGYRGYRPRRYQRRG